MKVAVMQPYFFPYIGYFQLVHAVDAFVVLDDVNFIKGGWINRNYILSRNGPVRLTLELQRASPNRLISEIDIAPPSSKLLKTVRQSYSRAPFFASAFALVSTVLEIAERNLARFLFQELHAITEFLGIDREWVMSSEIQMDSALRGQDRVLAICESIGATHYINLPGGRSLYDVSVFAERGIALSFIKSHPTSYHQFRDPFVANLSIIDALMFNSTKQCGQLLSGYDLD